MSANGPQPQLSPLPESLWAGSLGPGGHLEHLVRVTWTDGSPFRSGLAGGARGAQAQKEGTEVCLPSSPGGFGGPSRFGATCQQDLQLSFQPLSCIPAAMLMNCLCPLLGSLAARTAIQGTHAAIHMSSSHMGLPCRLTSSTQAPPKLPCLRQNDAWPRSTARDVTEVVLPSVMLEDEFECMRLATRPSHAGGRP